jgi:hypothetical protein
MGGGTNDRGSRIFEICESDEGVRRGDGFVLIIGDVDLDAEVGEARVLTGYECLLSEKAEARLTDQSLRRDCSRP